MNEFDQFVKRKLKARYYIRYADDFVFLSENHGQLLQIIPTIRRFLEDELHLDLHPDKIFIKTLNSGVDFLGWVNFPGHRVLRTATKRRILKRLETNRTLEIPNSYLGLLSHGNTRRIKNTILS